MSGPLGTDHPNSSSGRKSEQGAPNTQGLLCPCLGCLLDIHPSILHPQQLLTLCSGVSMADPTQESKWWLLLHKRQVNFNRRFIPHKENEKLLDLAWDPPSQPYTHLEFHLLPLTSPTHLPPKGPPQQLPASPARALAWTCWHSLLDARIVYRGLRNSSTVGFVQMAKHAK